MQQSSISAMGAHNAGRGRSIKDCLPLTVNRYWLLPARLATAAKRAGTITTESTIAIATKATTTTATTTIFARFGFIDLQGATAQFLAIELIDGRCGLLLRRHFHEAKAS